MIVPHEKPETYLTGTNSIITVYGVDESNPRKIVFEIRLNGRPVREVITQKKLQSMLGKNFKQLS
jgi:hypothetical protein